MSTLHPDDASLSNGPFREAAARSIIAWQSRWSRDDEELQPENTALLARAAMIVPQTFPMRVRGPSIVE